MPQSCRPVRAAPAACADRGRRSIAVLGIVEVPVEYDGQARRHQRGGQAAAQHMVDMPAQPVRQVDRGRLAAQPGQDSGHDQIGKPIVARRRPPADHLRTAIETGATIVAAIERIGNIQPRRPAAQHGTGAGIFAAALLDRLRPCAPTFVYSPGQRRQRPTGQAAEDSQHANRAPLAASLAISPPQDPTASSKWGDRKRCWRMAIP